MKLMVFNGSPRKGKNNTEQLINEFLKGYSLNTENSHELLKINDFPDNKRTINKILESNLIFLAFPLYNYFMPSGVKEFIENLLSNSIWIS